jgi:hypothetical protein
VAPVLKASATEDKSQRSDAHDQTKVSTARPWKLILKLAWVSKLESK